MLFIRFVHRVKIQVEGKRSRVISLEPLNHFTTLKYIQDAELVITDSGGVEREACWLGTPCKIMRDNSEWKECREAFGTGDAGDKIKMILEARKPYREICRDIS